MSGEGKLECDAEYVYEYNVGTLNLRPTVSERRSEVALLFIYIKLCSMDKNRYTTNGVIVSWELR